MIAKPKYSTTVQYTEEDKVSLEKCRNANYTNEDVFRLGLQKAVDQIEQGVAHEQGRD